MDSILTIPRSGRGRPAQRDSMGHAGDPAERERQSRTAGEHGVRSVEKAVGSQQSAVGKV